MWLADSEVDILGMWRNGAAFNRYDSRERDVHEFDIMIVARVTVCGIIVCVLLLACFHVLVCQTSKSLCAKQLGTQQHDTVLCLCNKAVVESNDNNTVDVINRCKCEKIDRPRIIDDNRVQS